MQPEKIDLTTASISDDKLAQLRQLLPEVFHEGTINFDELRNALGDYVEEDPANERFGLRWPGKSRLQQVINTPSVGTLVPQPEESVDWDTTGNMIIEGDNLEVLKLLQKSYAGKVKMIYIDPPYNTGNDFVYPDKYASGMDTYMELTGQKDGEGNKLASNSDTSGRYHANWLNMMYPRLYLARNLLRQDGVIFVSIDDAEMANLIQILNIVFGNDNQLANITVISNPRGRQSERFVASVHEYVLVFSRDASSVNLTGMPLTTEQASEYRYQEDNGRNYRLLGLRQRGVASRRVDRPDMYYPIYVNPRTAQVSMDPSDQFDVEVLPRKGDGTDGRWMWGKAKCRAEIQRLVPKLVAGRNEWDVFVKDYLEKGDGEVRTRKHKSIWDEKELNYQNGTTEVKNLFDNLSVAEYPKPVSLLSKTIQSASSESDVILDFFAGSGTTSHAAMQQNAEDGGNRKYILVQLPEPMEKKVLDDGTELTTIADVCRERVRRAGKKIAAEHPGKTIDTGFRAYKLAPSNFTPWDGTNDGTAETKPLLTSARQASFMPQTEQLTLEQRILHAADHLSPAASDIAVLTELLLKLGEELTVPVEKIILAGKTVYNIDDNLRLICLDRDLTLDVIRAMAEREPGEIICLDAGFTDDQTKVNAGQIIATQARQTESAIAFKVV